MLVVREDGEEQDISQSFLIGTRYFSVISEMRCFDWQELSCTEALHTILNLMVKLKQWIRVLKPICYAFLGRSQGNGVSGCIRLNNGTIQRTIARLVLFRFKLYMGGYSLDNKIKISCSIFPICYSFQALLQHWSMRAK